MRIYDAIVNMGIHRRYDARLNGELRDDVTGGDGDNVILLGAGDDAAFGGDCVMGLALGKDIHTDCSVNTVYLGTKYCFGNETARTLFLKRPDDFLLQAHIYHSSREQAAAEAAAESTQ